MVGDDGVIVVEGGIGVLVGTLPGSSEIGRLLCLAGEMGNSYLV